jgi:hypothetical protein
MSSAFRQLSSPQINSTLEIDLKRQGVTFPASHMRLGNILPGFLAIRCHQHTPLEDRRNGPANGDIQLQMLTGIGAGNAWHRASLAQIRRPVLSGGS